MRFQQVFIAFFLVINSFSIAYAQDIKSCLTADEMSLYNQVMQYRKQKGLSQIPLSKSLCIVAKTHVWDLSVNKPVKGDCNLHSWSSKGKWTACCYTSDHKQAAKMWSKPSELTEYKGNGYEISASGVSAATALEVWKKSSGHNQVIISGGIWAAHPWKAIGVGIQDGYAVIWFGEEEDPAGTTDVCK